MQFCYDVYAIIEIFDADITAYTYIFSSNKNKPTTDLIKHGKNAK